MSLGVQIVSRRGRKLASLCAALILPCSVLTAQQGPRTSAAGPSSSAAQPAAQMAVSSNSGSSVSAAASESKDDRPIMVKFGPGDLLEVAVYNVPELSTKARVSNSGEIYLPLIDYVHVAGLTQEEAQAVIEKRLEDGGFVRNPHVTIFVDDAQSQGVTLLGEVVRPGIYPDIADHKLYEILSQAGGFTPVASHKIAIIRKGTPEPIRIDLPRNLADDLSGNVDVLPGDTVTVPRAPIVYVVGDVAKPSGLVVDNVNLTVLQALALAGGTNRTAKMGAVRLIRKTSSGAMTETPVALKKMLEAKSPDFNLQPDDILFVPVSGFKVAAGKVGDAAVSAATAVSIYAAHP